MTDEEIISIAVKTSLLNYIDNETPRRFFVSGHAELDDVVSFGRVIAATALQKASNVMGAEVDYWRKDSASAWDKCEERRIENERLRAALDQIACCEPWMLGEWVSILARAALAEEKKDDR